MKSVVLATTTASLAILAPLAAQSYLGLEGFTPGDPLNSYSSGGLDVGGLQFLTGDDRTRLESIAWSATTANGIDIAVSLYSEGTSTTYGTLIGVLGNLTTSSPGIISPITMILNLDSEVILEPNTKYWVAISRPDLDGHFNVGRMTRTTGTTAGILDDYTSELGWTATGSRNSGAAASGTGYPPGGPHPVPYAFNIVASIVPEPSSAVLIGFAGLIATARRRREA